MNQASANTRKLTYCALFAAIATALMYFELPMPFMPPFLKLDISGVVSLLAAFMFGWGPAVMITLVKDMIHFFSSTSGGVGQIADFLMISTFSIIASYFYRKVHTKKGALSGLAIGSVAMTVMGVVTNKYMLIPFYSKLMPIEAILEACGAVNPLIGDINTYLLFGAAPFNILKAALLSALTMLLYKRLSVLIKSGTVKDPLTKGRR